MIKSYNKVSVLTNIPFEINEERVLRELRIPAKKKLIEIEEKNLGRELKRAIDTAYGLIHGKACYSTFRVKGIRDNKVILDKNNFLIKGTQIAKILKNCEFCSIFVATIGHELENSVSKLTIDDPARAFYLEYIANWMAEYMAKTVNNRISQEIVKAGFIPKKRYSAGYGDWPISSQRGILELIEAKRIGVSLSEAYLMIPRKSISALIGWGKGNSHSLKPI